MTRKIMEWRGCILMRLWSESSADILRWYVGKFWRYSHNRVGTGQRWGWWTLLCVAKEVGLGSFMIYYN